MPVAHSKVFLPLTLAWAAVVTLPGTLLAQPDPTLPPEPGEVVERNLEFLGEPATPQEEFERAMLYVELARLEPAKSYLAKFLAGDPTDDILLELREKHGPAIFLKMSNIEGLQPESLQVLRKVNAAFAKFANDPGRIDSLILDLGGTPERRAVAMVELRGAGAAVVPALLRALQNPANNALRERIVFVLVRIGQPGVPILLGALKSPHEDLQVAAIQALGHLRSREAIPYLWYPATAADGPEGTRDAARQALARILKGAATPPGELPAVAVVGELQRSAGEHLRQVYPWVPEADGLVTLWGWSNEREEVVPFRITPQQASIRVGSDLAWQALQLAPERHDVQVMYLSLALTSETEAAGWDRDWPSGPGTAHDLALGVGADVVQDVVTESLKSGQTRSAIAGIHVLAQIGTERQVRSLPGKQSALLRALDYPNQRVQFAAASAILQLDPKSRFERADRVVAILGRALRALGAGEKRSIVVDSFLERGTRMTGFLGEAGYQSIYATTGREAFRVAAERGDVELIVMHANVIRWGLSETLANLQADSRTAGIPVVIYGEAELRDAVRRHTEKNRLVMFAVEPAVGADLIEQMTPFLATVQPPPLTEAQRTAQTAAAAYWLAHIADGQRTNVFPLDQAESVLLAAADEPDLAQNAILALASIGTRASQEKLAQLALTGSIDLSLRAAAATQLAFHIQRFSLVLPTDTVRELQTAWKATGDQEAELHTALGGVVGSLQPDSALVGTRLREFRPAPATPAPPAPAPGNE